MRRDELESAATNYFYLRGLFSVPAGILMISAGLGNLGWGPFAHIWIFPGAVLVAAVAYLLIARHYAARYGRVTLGKTARVKAGIAAVVSAAVVAGGVQADWSAGLPISATTCAFALVMVATCAVTVGVRVHHAIIWGGLVVVGLLPGWEAARPDIKINVGLLLVGAATIVAGIFDHGALKRGFGRVDVRMGNGDAGA